MDNERWHRVLVTFLIVSVVFLAGCNLPWFNPTPKAEKTPVTETPAGPATEELTPIVNDATVLARAGHEQVQALIGQSQPQALPEGAEETLREGDGVTVDEFGRAILRFPDATQVEVLRDGDLVIQQLDLGEQDIRMTLVQRRGVTEVDISDRLAVEFTLETEFARITATGTGFIVAREEGSPLEWVVGLDSAPGDLQVTADGVTKDVVSNQARWIAPEGEPSPGIEAQMGEIFDWVASIQEGAPVREIGEVVFPPADVVLGTGEFEDLPPVGEPTSYGPLSLTLFEGGEYFLEDCNGDGALDLGMVGGGLQFDFRSVLSRVRALDVTVINFGEPGGGTLVALNPGEEEAGSQDVLVGEGQTEILSLRSEQPYHFAELFMDSGCFLGLSLTPPDENGEPGPPRSVVPVGPYVRIDQPLDGSTTTRNGFLLSGVSSVPFERTLTLRIETLDGEPLQVMPLFVEGGELGGALGVFSEEVFVDYNLPADLRVRVQDISARDGSVLAEDVVTLTPLLPLEGSGERPALNGRFVALPVGESGYGPGIKVDGSLQEWFGLLETGGGVWQELETVVYDQGCQARFPGLPAELPDLEGRVAFAYDEKFLYVAFWVDDEGYVGYSGEGELYFQGDSPQLLLDIDLEGDFSDAELSADDLQVDFLPGVDEPGDSPSAALWQLERRSVRVFREALIAAGLSNSGYFVEAAIPWSGLRYVPEPGARLGVVASISDNDTLGTDVQECMISSAPERDWQNPTTWGTLVLQPPPG